MNTIAGRITVEESGLGIPNLVVVVYDADPRSSGQVATHVPSSNDGSGELLPSDRIGSVLTDADGRFELQYDESAFSQLDQEERPDLVAFVMAPETTQVSSDGLPTAVSPDEQVIHISNIPRVDAGQVESYSIVLRREQLEEAGVPVPEFDRELNAEQRAQQYISAINETAEFEEQVSDGLADMRRNRAESRLAIHEEAKSKTQALTAVPPALRVSEFFVPDPVDTEALEAAQTMAVESGRERLEEYRERSQASRPLVASRNTLIDVGIDFENAPVTVSRQDRCSLLRPERQGWDLTEARSLLEAASDVFEISGVRSTGLTPGSTGTVSVTIQYLGKQATEGVEASLSLSPPLSSDGSIEALGDFNPYETRTVLFSVAAADSAPAEMYPVSIDIEYPGTGGIELTDTLFTEVSVERVGETGDEGSSDFEKTIQDRVEGQLADLIPYNGADGHVDDPLVRLDQTLDELVLSSGPANVTSYHDFHSLQIAFRDIWTEAFDPTVKVKAGRAYELAVQHFEKHNLDFDSFAELRELRDIQDLIDGVENSVNFTEETVPAKIREIWQDEVTTERWSLLSSEQRELMWGIISEYDSVLTTENQGEVARTHYEPRSEESKRELYRDGLKILSNPYGIRHRLIRTLLEIQERIYESYAFTYFVPNSVNYGLLTTYRQEWKPGPYQVGELASTIPLAPGESRKYNSKEVVKRARSSASFSRMMTVDPTRASSNIWRFDLMTASIRKLSSRNRCRSVPYRVSIHRSLMMNPSRPPSRRNAVPWVMKYP